VNELSEEEIPPLEAIIRASVEEIGLKKIIEVKK